MTNKKSGVIRKKRTYYAQVSNAYYINLVTNTEL